jgi:hypothetical protein
MEQVSSACGGLGWFFVQDPLGRCAFSQASRSATLSVYERQKHFGEQSSLGFYLWVQMSSRNGSIWNLRAYPAVYL